MVIFLAALLWMQARAGGLAAVSPSDPVDALDAQFVLDLHDKKIDDVLTLYTGNAVFVQPDGTEVSGPGIKALYEQVAKAYDSDLRLQRTDLKRSVNTVIEDGTYTESLGHRDTGKTDHVKGTYRFTMHLDADGKWRFSRMEWH